VNFWLINKVLNLSQVPSKRIKPFHSYILNINNVDGHLFVFNALLNFNSLVLIAK
jgi:hypothetical protein